MSLSPTRLTISEGEAARHLVLEGDLDSHTAPQLDAAIQALGAGGGIVLHLDRVAFIDSSGLRVIITTHSNLDEQGQQLTLIGPAPPVVRLFEITGLTEHLHII